jgi:hypothetical protein
MAQSIYVAIEQGDITSIDADVIVLKYAQSPHGADRLVANKLAALGIAPDGFRPTMIGETRLVATKGAVTAGSALFVGTPSIAKMTYADVRTLASTALTALKTAAPQTVHVAMTIHGPGFGLDELESCVSQLYGYQDAIRTGDYPATLRRITIVDRDAGRVERLRQGVAASDVSLEFRSGDEDSVGKPPAAELPAKPYAFVAMPFSDHFQDVYNYGIQVPVHRAGLLCERMDYLTFTGEIVDWMKRKIETATVVIADVSGGNPNVYLEIGYAWGKGRPTILIANDIDGLAFDVRGNRCLQYGNITALEETLAHELQELRARHLI